MKDIQSDSDTRGIALDWVGLKDLERPILWEDQSTVASLCLWVDLPAHERGTHMSRMAQLAYGNVDWSAEGLKSLSAQIRHTVGARHSRVELRFKCFVERSAPVSKLPSLIPLKIFLQHTYKEGTDHIQFTVTSPVQSLCPCSKAISESGAHNQRSELTYTLSSVVSIQNVLAIAERSASSALYGVLKRADEKFVTESAYTHPKFVEDLVRDSMVNLKAIFPNLTLEVCAENFESIHPYNVWAQASHKASLS